MRGRRYDPALVRQVQQRGIVGQGAAADPGPQGRWFVLLDAAKAAACRPPDLAAAPADFVVRSTVQDEVPIPQPHFFCHAGAVAYDTVLCLTGLCA